MTGQLHKLTDSVAWMTAGDISLALYMPEFIQTLKGLAEDDQRLLIRAQMAAIWLGGDASRERSDIIRCIERLRDELKEKAQ